MKNKYDIGSKNRKEFSKGLIINKREELIGIPPESIPLSTLNISLSSTNKDSFTVHKSSKNGQTSFRITKGLLESLIETSIKIKKQPKLILTIDNEYVLTCSLTKTKAR